MISEEMRSLVPDTELWRWEQQPVISSSACWLSSAFRRIEEAREEEVEERRSAWAEAWRSTLLQPLHMETRDGDNVKGYKTIFSC